MTIKKLRVGTRSSLLALKQVEWVAERIKRKYPEVEIEIVKIKTQGDKYEKENRPLSFVKEIEEALIKEEIDIAVHSMKDLPTNLPKELYIAAITEREDPRDVLISKKGSLNELPPYSILGTSSLRRKVQILNYRKDLLIKHIRGNVDTRLRKLEEGSYDAIVLAAAGLIRLGWRDRITEFISTDICLPAPGQGALGIEIRKEDIRVGDIVSFLNHQSSFYAVSGERSFSKNIGGGCDFPIAAYGEIYDEKLELKGFFATDDGGKIIKDNITGEKKDFEKLGVELSEKILQKGGKEILGRYKEKR